MGIVLKADDRGRITLPVKVEPYSLMPLWKNGVLYLIKVKQLLVSITSFEEATKFNNEIEKYRVKGLPYEIPRTYEPSNRITIPKAVRVSKFWEFEETTFKFDSLGREVPAYKLIPLKVVPLKDSL